MLHQPQQRAWPFQQQGVASGKIRAFLCVLIERLVRLAYCAALFNRACQANPNAAASHAARVLLLSQFVSYPLALVRTRLQAQGVGGNPIKYSGMVDVFSQTLRNEGFSGLYKVGPCCCRLAPSQAAWVQSLV